MKIDEFATKIIEGPVGMNVFQAREVVSFPYSDRVAAAVWTMRCLANPRCEGSEEAILAILEKRGTEIP
jgi:hypothetical protein